MIIDICIIFWNSASMLSIILIPDILTTRVFCGIQLVVAVAHLVATNHAVRYVTRLVAIYNKPIPCSGLIKYLHSDRIASQWDT